MSGERFEHDEPACEGCGCDRGHEEWCDFAGVDEPLRPVRMLVATEANEYLINALQDAEDARDAARAELDAARRDLSSLADDNAKLRAAGVNDAGVSNLDAAMAENGRLRTALAERTRERDEAVARAEKLERTVVRNAGHRASNNGPRWAFVADALAIGSTSAIEACRRHGLEPDECVGSGTTAAKEGGGR